MADWLGIYGASGCGRGLMPLARGVPRDRRVFIDDGASCSSANGYRVMRWEEFLSLEGDKAACVAVADGKVRARLVDRIEQAGVALAGVRADTVTIMDEVEIGAGACLSPFVTLTSNIVIGRAFHANLYSYVEHDCVIGDFVTFAPRVSCNGNVRIGDGAYIGAGALIRQGRPDAPLRIGAGAVVGMGAVVTRSVAPGETVVGNPARPMEARRR